MKNFLLVLLDNFFAYLNLSRLNIRNDLKEVKVKVEVKQNKRDVWVDKNHRY